MNIVEVVRLGSAAPRPQFTHNGPAWLLACTQCDHVGYHRCQWCGYDFCSAHAVNHNCEEDE